MTTVPGDVLLRAKNEVATGRAESLSAVSEALAMRPRSAELGNDAGEGINLSGTRTLVIQRPCSC